MIVSVIGLACNVEDRSGENIFLGCVFNYIDHTFKDVLIGSGIMSVMIPVTRVWRINLLWK